MDSFWDFFWFTISFFLLFAYLMVLFQIVGDLFRDHTVSGGMKAVWIICLIFFPFITMVVYLIARGHGMAERHLAAAQGMKARAGRVHPLRGGLGRVLGVRRDRAGRNPCSTRAPITQQEFDALKAKALAEEPPRPVTLAGRAGTSSSSGSTTNHGRSQPARRQPRVREGRAADVHDGAPWPARRRGARRRPRRSASTTWRGSQRLPT